MKLISLIALSICASLPAAADPDITAMMSCLDVIKKVREPSGYFDLGATKVVAIESGRSGRKGLTLFNSKGDATFYTADKATDCYAAPDEASKAVLRLELRHLLWNAINSSGDKPKEGIREAINECRKLGIKGKVMEVFPSTGEGNKFDKEFDEVLRQMEIWLSQKEIGPLLKTPKIEIDPVRPAK